MTGLRRHADLLIALVFAIAIQLELWLYEDGPRGEDGVTVTAALLFPAALVLRTRRPDLMVAAASYVLVTQSLLGGRLTTTLSVAFVSMALMFSAGLNLPHRRGVAWALVFLAATWIDLIIVEAADYGVVSDLAFTLVIAVGAPFLAGRALRERRERAEELERLNRELVKEREHRAQMAVLDERARIAREMHDVVAHSVSLMVVQAGAARHLLDEDPEQSRGALFSVEATGRQALGELRRALGLLRGGGDAEPLDLAPQPGTAQLQALVERTRASGLPVELVIEGDPRPVPPGVDLAAYRIVQEALTNTVKHAGEARAAVRVRWLPDALELDVLDDGRGPNGYVSPDSHGLVGMRERVAAYGGTVEAGPATGGGFAVRARIPLSGEGGP